LFRVVRRDAELLVRPGRRVGVGEVALGERRAVPEVPEDPEPHEAAEELAPDHLRPRQLRELPVPRRDVHPAAR
ncbi:hypothetical protein FQA23_0010935, partial [Aptenodytes patagonicus]